MKALRWLAIALLLYGLFTGIAYALTPVFTERWGNPTTSLIGVGLIVLCVAALVRLDPRRR